jgi:hypothetical protein
MTRYSETDPCAALPDERRLTSLQTTVDPERATRWSLLYAMDLSPAGVLWHYAKTAGSPGKGAVTHRGASAGEPSYVDI